MNLANRPILESDVQISRELEAEVGKGGMGVDPRAGREGIINRDVRIGGGKGRGGTLWHHEAPRRINVALQMALSRH